MRRSLCDCVRYVKANPSVLPDKVRLKITRGGVTYAWPVPVADVILLEIKKMLAEPVSGKAVKFADCVEDGLVPTSPVLTPKVDDTVPLELDWV